MAIIKAQDYAPANMAIEFSRLTAATQSTDSIKMTKDDGSLVWKNIVFQNTVVLNTSTAIVVRAQGSLDNANWFNLDEADSDTTYSAAGTYAMKWDGDGDVNYVRLYWVSEAGSTDATLDVIAKVSGGAPL